MTIKTLEEAAAEIIRLQGVCESQLEQMKSYWTRINELERNNSIMAGQLGRRVGMWLAPNELDDEMVNIVMDTKRIDGEIPEHLKANRRAFYKAMRDNWLGRLK